MKILLTAIGTRGDMEPFLAIGQILRERGEEVVFALPAQYSHLVADECRCHPLSPKFLELVEGPDGRIVMGKAPWWKKLRSILRMYRLGMAVNREMNRELYDIAAAEQPDCMVHHAKCNYPVLWGMSTGKPTVLVSPIPYLMHEVPGHAHVGFSLPFGAWGQKISYRLGNFGLAKTIKDAQATLPNPTHFSRQEILAALQSYKLAFTISPDLFTRPASWPEQVQILGYHERNKQIDWEPSQELEQFLDQHDKVLLVTFGSMLSSDPVGVSRMVYRVLAQLEIPAIINIAGGGLVNIEAFQNDPSYLVVPKIPYDWALPRVYGIIHHGGSGTTHSGLKYGCVSLILPHIMDQFAWNDLVHEQGVGPKGCSINRLTEQKLKTLVRDMMTQPGYAEKARQLAARMQAEDLEETLYTFIVSNRL